MEPGAYSQERITRNTTLFNCFSDYHLKKYSASTKCSSANKTQHCEWLVEISPHSLVIILFIFVPKHWVGILTSLEDIRTIMRKLIYNHWPKTNTTFNILTFYMWLQSFIMEEKQQTAVAWSQTLFTVIDYTRSLISYHGLRKKKRNKACIRNHGRTLNVTAFLLQSAFW